MLISCDVIFVVIELNGVVVECNKCVFELGCWVVFYFEDVCVMMMFNVVELFKMLDEKIIMWVDYLIKY